MSKKNVYSERASCGLHNLPLTKLPQGAYSNYYFVNSYQVGILT